MAEKKKGPGRPPGSKNKNSRKSNISPDVKKNVQKLEMRRENKAQIKDEILGIILIALGVFLVIALQTHAAGIVGESISRGLKGMFGFVAFVLPYYFILYGILLFLKKTIHIGIKSVIFLVFIYLGISLVNSGRFMDSITTGGSWGGFSKCFNDGVALNGGGVFGMGVGSLLTKAFGIAGLYIIAFALIIVFLLLLINTPISRFFENIKFRKQRRELEREERAKERETMEAQHAEQMKMELETGDPGMSAGQKKIMGYMAENVPDPGAASAENKKTKRTRASRKTHGPEILGAGADETAEKTAPVREEAKRLTKKEAEESRLAAGDFISNTGDRPYEFPPIDLLKAPKRTASMATEGELRERAELLEDTLESFGIEASVENVIQGPSVTRYEVHPNTGVKVSSITKLIDDIALCMAAKSIRIEAPIPGKRAVGIEIENIHSNAVTIREILDSDEFRNAVSKLSFAVGRDIGGKAVVADLATMPHLLIAGTTGSGKSVCINSIIASLLYKAHPDEVKMVMIDPKMVELSDYNGIPHLLIPVVTDPAKAAAALNWAVSEMEDRYKKFAESGVRDFAAYNAQRVKEKNRVTDGETEGPLPQIVIIIDELADLMMTASTQVETSIIRLAQKARAAGMHVIIATQRPSKDVITGLMKANIPSRIAFAVSSNIDSRIILDTVGAERLVGKGDMLFAPIGSSKPTRVQGTFISDGEVKKLIAFVQKQGTMDEAAEADVLDTIERVNTPDADKSEKDPGDDLLPDAIELVVGAGSASVSMLQRRFRIGYNRAARIIDMMEERQIVGPPDGSRPRQVLISEEDLANLKAGSEENEQ
ncbi:MAG: DNA translocase FtsK 4TM domain-containing protein [Bacillota bacterium]|nr:DNA translocase FtsK 4TM domain-containing protein [Bacillota bacterium]